MKYFIQLITASYLVATLAACTKDTTVTQSTAKAVVEAYLTPNQNINVSVTKEIVLSTTDSVVTQQAIDGLTVQIANNGKTYTLKGAGLGNYQGDSTLKVIAGQTYSLQFIYNGNTISASTMIPTKTDTFNSSANTIQAVANGSPFTNIASPVELTWSNPNNEYHIVVVQNTDLSPTPINPAHIGNRRFRNSPNQGTTYELRPFSFQYFGNYLLLLYKLNPEYASLYNDNGNTSQNLTPPYSNVTNALGIFTGVNIDTLNFTVTR